MKTTTTLLLALLLATSAFAIIDPDPDHMGLYFDLEADVFCLDGVAQMQVMDLYLIVTNPSFASISGFEAGIIVENTALVVDVVFANPEALNVGNTTNMIVGFGSPTMTEAATLLATMQIMYLEDDGLPVFFDLVGSQPSSADPMYPLVVANGGEIMSMGASGGDSYEAQINFCFSSVERVSFDGIKSLYR